MNKQWQAYCEKFLQITVREQYLILLTGLVAILFITFHLFVDPTLVANNKTKSKIERLINSNKSLTNSIADLELSLQSDPNVAMREKITQFETKLAKVDAKLLTLTSDLINPIQMRHALFDLLKVEKGVSLLSFELLDVQPLLHRQEASVKKVDQQSQGELENSPQQQQTQTGSNLYRHGIKIRLSGGYFELQSYLQQLEQLSWTFFWQDFNFKVTQYPQSELEITLYSLSTKKEFVGV